MFNISKRDSFTTKIEFLFSLFSTLQIWKYTTKWMNLDQNLTSRYVDDNKISPPQDSKNYCLKCINLSPMSL